MIEIKNSKNYKNLIEISKFLCEVLNNVKHFKNFN